jgi:nucleoside-diphosphate-sugar epimerase
VTYGPGDTSAIREVLVQYLTGKLPMVPDKTAYSWAHVDDTAHGHLQAMERGKIGESYFLTGPAHTLADALQIAERITGIKAPRIKAAPAMLKAMSVMMELVEKLIPISGQYSSETLRVSAGVTYLGSSAKAERQLGFTARSLEEGLRETLAYEMKLLGIG